MTKYLRDEIRVGLEMAKDCSDAVFIAKEPATSTVPLSEIHEKLERVRKKIAVLAQVMATNRTRH